MTAPSASLGKTIAVRVMATDREANLVALSRKAALEEMSERTLKTLREGQVRTATIRTLPEQKVLIVCDQEPEREMSALNAWVLCGERAPT